MWAKLQTALTVVCGSTMVWSWFAMPPTKSWLAVVAIASGSVFALRSAWYSIRDRSVDVNILMVLAAAGSVALGHLGEAAILLFLFSLSNTLESYAMGRTRSAIEGLVKLRPDTAILVGEAGDTETDVRSIQVGDTVRVLPYQTVPLDGEVWEGQTHVDQAAMTGESASVARAVGDTLLAGTQNLEGAVTMKVTSLAGQTTLDKVVELVADAQENKASGERVSHWFGQTYTWLVIAAFGLAFGIRLALGQEVAVAAYGALALLVALSPCALVISTPATTLSALAWAAKNGILIRGGQFIEACGSIDTIFVDKTGTLTRGRPVLSEICICSEEPALVSAPGACGTDSACWHGGEMGAESKDLLAVAAAAEQYSTHPIADAIVAGARSRGIVVPEATSVEVVAGKGVVAQVGGAEARIGQPTFFAEFPPGFQYHADKMRDDGMTVAVLQQGDLFAALGLRDEVREQSSRFVSTVKQMGVSRVEMLTGDNDVTARVVHNQVATDAYHAGLLPADKERLVSEAVDSGRTVMFVGDGINDAPSLAKAHVGVAMGGLGSDVALNAADIVLMQDRLDLVPAVLSLGKKTNRIIRANLLFAATVIVGLTVMTFVLGNVAPKLANLVLPFAVVGHEGSTVLVILNGLRLLRGPQRLP